MIEFPRYYDQERKERLARSLFLANGMKELAEFRQFLSDELSRLDVENRSEPDAFVFRQRQGACRTLAALIRQMTEASRTFDQLKGL